MGAATAGQLSTSDYFLGQAMVTATQLTAHYVNEYADVDADRTVVNRTWFSGGSGVLVDGTLPVAVGLWAAIVTSFLATATMLGLLAAGKPSAASIGVLALLVAWTYSIPPIRLVGTGWGELVTSVVVVVLVPFVGAASQGVGPSVELWWAAAVLLPVHMALLLTFELPDLESDAAVGKRVLGVRIGRRATMAAVAGFLLAAGLVLGLAQSINGLPPASQWVWLGALPATGVVVTTRAERHGIATASAVATLAVVATVLLISLAA